MNADERAELRRKANAAKVQRWREAHPLETLVHRLRWYETREVRKAYRDLIKEGA